jgi:hypothetical protein
MVDIEELAATVESMPEVLSALLTPLDPVGLRCRPAHGEWCGLEVIEHLVVVEGPAFRDRIERIVEGEPEILDVVGPALATSEELESHELGGLLDQLRRERAQSAAFLRSLSPDDLDRTAEHHKYGMLTAGDFAHEWAYHDQDHLQQILDATKTRYADSMSANMRKAIALGS